jgi:ADP-dependent NAD(P)H-hydrate dehydratase / NAD(P)H-hydrate epimerase
VKILSAAQIREGDAFTIKHEPIKSTDLMERAGEKCFDWIYDNAPKIFPANKEERDWVFNVFCGVGNNGGDGLVVARLLNKNGYDVKVFVAEFSEKQSSDFQVNYEKIKKSKIAITHIKKPADIPIIEAGSMVIDAIFGTGITRKVEGVTSEVIKAINQSECMVVSIDLPSGLMDADNSENDISSIIKANYTLALEFIKLAFLFPENESFVGVCKLIKIGIHAAFIESVATTNFLTEEWDIQQLLKSRSKFSHKGSFGHTLIVAGSYGKYGAACLSAKGALRSGAGLVSVLAPKSGMQVIQSSVNEAMFVSAEGEDFLCGNFDTTGFDSIAIGPGIGTNSETPLFLRNLLTNTKVSMVLDADALNLLASDNKLLTLVPENSILTPHTGEFKRLAGDWTNDYERFQKQISFSQKHKVYVVLKGAHTSVSCPDGKVFFNSTGNSGMATAGSGDVLTGIIASLLAQGHEPKSAAIIGVYLHGHAGDIALWDTGFEAMLASDIINCLGKAFLSFTLPSNK